MVEQRIGVGQSIEVTTPDGCVMDVVTDVVTGTPSRGVWIVDTRRHGRVVVMPGQSSLRPSAEE